MSARRPGRVTRRGNNLWPLCSNTAVVETNAELAGRLAEIAAFEGTVHGTPVTRMLRRIGRTRGFVAFYRRVGPKIDPWLLRSRAGRRLHRLYGLPALLLDSTGAKTGTLRTSPLLYLRDEDDFVVVGTNFGQLHHPGWTANLLAKPQGSVEVGRIRVAVEARLVDQADWDRTWPRFCAVYPGYANYLETCGDRVPRMFRLHPVA